MDSSCIICGGELPIRAKGQTGPASPCCSSACKRKRENQCSRDRRALNSGEARQYQREWYAANPDRIRGYSQKKATAVRATSRRHYLANREAILERCRQRTLAGAAKAQWRKRFEANPESVRAIGRKKSINRRAMKLNAFIEAVDPLVVYERDRGVCGICSRQILQGHKWHVDHIVPLSKGGAHSYANAQLSHALCNMSKGAKMPAVWATSQKVVA